MVEKEGYAMNVKEFIKKYGIQIGWGMLLVYGAACMYLFYMQSIQPLDYNNRYFQSDLPYHISMIIDDGWYYSFTAYAYQILYLLAGKTTVGIACFLTLMALLSIVLSDKLIRVLAGEKERSLLTMASALGLNMVMPFFWKAAGIYRYVSYQSGNIWHNSTYQCMKVFALAALLCYLDIEKDYKEKISWKKWGGFMILLVVCTGIKPSFLTVFAPAMALKLLWDLFHKVSFKQIFIFGCAVLPACGVVLWQNAVLFGEETGQGFAINPWFTFSLHANRPKLAVLCSIAFPLAVAVCSLKEIFKDEKYFFGWMMTGIGFFEALLLAETGSRSRDGNFLWSYCFAIFYIFVISFVKWLKLGRRKQWICKPAFLGCGIVLTYQLYCGLVFFVRLLLGETYFMIG